MGISRTTTILGTGCLSLTAFIHAPARSETGPPSVESSIAVSADGAVPEAFGPPATEGATPLSPLFDVALQRLRVAETPAERRRQLRAIEQLALDLKDVDRAAARDALTFVGTELSLALFRGERAVAEASSPFQAIIDHELGWEAEINAHRVLGQTAWFHQGRIDAAAAHYRSMLALLDAAPASEAGQRVYAMSLPEALLKLAMLESSRGRHDAAIALRERLFSEPVILERSRLVNAMIEQARDQSKAGDHAGAAEQFDEIFRRFPGISSSFGDYRPGAADGDIVLLEQERLQSREPEPNSPDHIDALFALWRNAEYSGFPQSLTIGVLLESRLMEIGERESPRLLRLFEEVDERFDQLLDEAEPPSWDPDFYVRNLLYHVQHYGASLESRGELRAAASLYEKFAEHAPDHPAASSAAARAEGLRGKVTSK